MRTSSSCQEPDHLLAMELSLVGQLVLAIVEEQVVLEEPVVLWAA